MMAKLMRNDGNNLLIGEGLLNLGLVMLRGRLISSLKTFLALIFKLLVLKEILIFSF
jgi:hypothetical protein